MFLPLVLLIYYGKNLGPSMSLYGDVENKGGQKKK